MEKIIEIKFGSHLYGTDTPQSDLDFKAIYIPSGREIVLHSYVPTIVKSRAKAEGERNTKDDIDIEILSLDQFLRLLMQGQTMALDMLFGAHQNYTFTAHPGVEHFQTIYDNREKLITKNVAAFVGYARQQAAKYGIKGSRMDALQRAMAMLETLPLANRLSDHRMSVQVLVEVCNGFVTLEKTPLVEVVEIADPNGVLRSYLQVCGRKIAFSATVKVAKECFGKILAEYGGRARKANLDGGIDWKALSHAVRVNSEAVELLQKNFITFPRPDRELLKQIKLGWVAYEDVAERIELGLVELYDAQAKSPLRETPDREWAEDFIYDVYSRRVR